MNYSHEMDSDQVRNTFRTLHCLISSESLINCTEKTDSVCLFLGNQISNGTRSTITAVRRKIIGEKDANWNVLLGELILDKGGRRSAACI